MQFNPMNVANPLLYAAVNNNNENIPGGGGAGFNIANPVAGGGGVVAAAPVNNGNEDNAANRPDVLDMIYKAIRFLLLLMVLYVYSSFERFFVVLLTISLIWFVQRQRERRNRNEQIFVQQNLVQEQVQQRQNNVENENGNVADQPRNNGKLYK